MALNVYEGMFILDSNRYARNPGSVAARIPELVEKQGGEMLVSRLWNEQKLAYTIKGHRKGTYWLTYFRLDSGKLTELSRQLKLDANVLRNLILKVDPRLVAALVAHASGEPAAPDTSETPKASETPTDADKPADTSDKPDETAAVE